MCRNPRKFLWYRCPLHRHLAWPRQPRLLHLLFRPCLPLFWPPSPPRSSKCCRPSKLQALRLVVYLQAWPISEAFLLRLLSPANLLPKRRRLPPSGGGFSSPVPATAISPASGRPNSCVVPTFVSTFSSPVPSLAHSAFPSNLNAALP